MKITEQEQRIADKFQAYDKLPKQSSKNDSEAINLKEKEIFSPTPPN